MGTHPIFESDFDCLTDVSSMILTEVLGLAIGSGDDVGSLNLKHLKAVLGTILEKMEINDANVADSQYDRTPIDSYPGQSGGDGGRGADGASADQLKELQDKLDALEQTLDQMNRPASPNTVLEDAKEGGDAIKKDWAVTKLKKRVDANEGIERLNNLLDSLAKQIKNLENEQNNMADRVDSEQKEQDANLEQLKRTQETLQNNLDALNDQLANNNAEDTLKELEDKLNQLKEQTDANKNELDNNCVKWEDLDKTFNEEIVKPEAEKSLEDKREKYPKYFEGLQTLSDYQKKLDDALEELKKTNEELGNVKNKTDKRTNDSDETAKDLDATNENLERAEQATNQNKGAIDDLEQKLKDMMDRNAQLEKDLARYKSDTDRELASQRQVLESAVDVPKGNSIDQETIERLQDQLSGTEDELDKLRSLIEQLNKEGADKNKELEQLQKLLEQLQEQAAMRDFVLANLDEKANKSDFEGLLSRDDLDETAQAIIAQLQDLIAKQASTEAELANRIANLDDNVAQRTKDDEFNPFRDEIEKRLRSLRKKIENAKKEDLDSLTTAAGAAGFRKQLFNCISCDKPLHMRTGEPVLNLPQPSSFPARISLRPNMTYEADHVRQLTKSHNGDLGPLRREHSMTSNYSNLVVEKELERRRKLREAKMRQESNPYNFNSGKIPRQAGGNINPQKAAEAYYNAKERDEAGYLEANLEGTDGLLYRGRVQKLPDINSHRVPSPSVGHERATAVASPVPESEQPRPSTSNEADRTPPIDSVKE